MSLVIKAGLCSIGVRSGIMAQLPNAGVEQRATQFIVRPPTRFVTGTDFTLWIQRVELYMKEAAIPEEKKGQELISLLEDDAFRIVSQMGLLCADTVEYAAMKTCLHSFRDSSHQRGWKLSGSVDYIQHSKRRQNL